MLISKRSCRRHKYRQRRRGFEAWQEVCAWLSVVCMERWGLLKKAVPDLPMCVWARTSARRPAAPLPPLCVDEEEEEVVDPWWMARLIQCSMLTLPWLEVGVPSPWPPSSSEPDEVSVRGGREERGERPSESHSDPLNTQPRRWTRALKVNMKWELGLHDIRKMGHYCFSAAYILRYEYNFTGWIATFGTISFILIDWDDRFFFYAVRLHQS